MILYYTGAVASLQQQKDPSKSLGGWISNTVIPNGRLGNLFSGLSLSLIENPISQLRVIVLKNTSGSDLTDVKLYTTTPDGAQTTWKLGVATPSIDPTCNEPYFETLDNENTLPYYTELSDAEAMGNAINIPTLANNGYIGIFIQRDVKNSVMGYNGAEITCDQVVTQSESTDEVIDEESVSLVIDYNINP